jgi:hypothetical protein
MPLGETITRVVDGQEEYIYMCSECEAEHHYEDEAMDCCTFMCPNCGDIYEEENEASECCAYECEFCGAHYNSEEWMLSCCEGERERQLLFNPDYPETVDQTEPEHVIYVPAIENRPSRVCSIEQELSRGGAAVARLLNRIGISEYDRIMNYSFESMPGTAVVKEDGSLPTGGGEAVFSRFLLSNQRDMRSLSKALACIEELRREGIVEVNESAGTHVHISALDLQRKAFGPAQIAALYEIFSFSEDVVFRIGSAGWPNHRGTEYTRLMPKLGRESDGITPSKISKQAQRERYFSLNFRRLLNAAQSCRCGAAIVGDWDGCDCGVLDTGTVEWRVFNATTDPEIIHSWLLLAHGMTGASFGHVLGTLEPHDYGSTDPELHPWIFGWLLWNCPFEDGERQLLFNTARKSPGLNLPWENIDSFHTGWESMEIPETAQEGSLIEDPFDSPTEFDDPYDEVEYEDESSEELMRRTCTCADCTRWREEHGGSDPVFSEPQVMVDWQSAVTSTDRVQDALRRITDTAWQSTNVEWGNSVNWFTLEDNIVGDNTIDNDTTNEA